MWGQRYPGIEDDLMDSSLIAVCARQRRHSVESVVTQLAEFPPDQVHELRFEELEKLPECFERVCRFIGIDDIDPIVFEPRRIVRPSETMKWKSHLLLAYLRTVQISVST